MTLIRRAVVVLNRAGRTLNLLERQNQLILSQDDLIERQRRRILELKLEHNRELLGVFAAWRIHMETPEIDLRDDITALATELGNQIAALEEHVIT